MNRRTLIAWGLAGTAWPLTVHAQQPTSTVIGFLSGRSRDESARDAAAFRDGLSEMGYVEGQNLAIEYRWGREPE